MTSVTSGLGTGGASLGTGGASSSPLDDSPLDDSPLGTRLVTAAGGGGLLGGVSRIPLGSGGASEASPGAGGASLDSLGTVSGGLGGAVELGRAESLAISSSSVASTMV